MKCPNPVTRTLVYDGSHWITDSSVPTRSGPHRTVTYPCGHCFACRINHAKHWAARCSHEASCHEENMFLNLTINDNSLPKLFESVPLTARIANSVISARRRSSYTPSGDFSYDVLKTGTLFSLSYRPIQLFLKRLRKHYSDRKIRFFCAAEYGPLNMRPHFHLLVFGLRPSDLVPHSRRGSYVLYTSETISKLWSDPKTGESYGFCSIGSVTPSSANYCAQYCMKKQKGRVNRESYYGLLTPEFIHMSKGIGRDWFIAYHSDVYPTGIIHLEGKAFCGVPRYYSKLFEQIFPHEYSEYQHSRLQTFVTLHCLNSDTLRAYYVSESAALENAARISLVRETVYNSDEKRSML